MKAYHAYRYRIPEAMLNAPRHESSIHFPFPLWPGYWLNVRVDVHDWRMKSLDSKPLLCSSKICAKGLQALDRNPARDIVIHPSLRHAMLRSLIDWVACPRRRSAHAQVLSWHPATQAVRLNEALLQDLVEWLDWESLREIQSASAATSRLMHSEAFLTLIATRRGLSEEACLIRMCLQGFAVADRLRKVSPSIYFERASTGLREDSHADIWWLADTCKLHSRLVIFASGHCGRNAPESIKSSFTLLRASTVCQEISELLPLREPEMYVFGCGSSVAGRDILFGGPEDWSKADLRAELRAADGALLVDWGRKWWEPFQGSDELDLPDWQLFTRLQPAEPLQ